MKITRFEKILIAGILLFCHFLMAQGNTIKGNLISNKNALEFATVTLSKKADSTKIIHNTVSDSIGNFVFLNLEMGQYQIKAGLIGYVTRTQNLIISPENKQIKLLDFELVEDTKLLQSVTVIAQKKLIEKTTQGFIVNAAANFTQAGGTATDILKNTPTVNVDAEGVITLRGKTPTFLINGRVSTLTNPDQIPASSVESIEIINNASSKYDANAESGIINIKLKKNKTDGTNGNFAIGAGAGYKGRTNSSILLNNKNKKWNLGLAYDNRFAGRRRSISGARTNFFLPEVYQISQSREDKRVEQLQNVKFNVDYLNDKNNISFEAIGNAEGQDNDERLNTVISNQSEVFKSNASRQSLEYARGKVAEFALNYSRQFANDTKTLTANIATSLNYDRENTNIISQAFSENHLKIGQEYYERTHNYEDGYITNANLDHAFTIPKIGQIETGYRGVFRELRADYQYAQNINGTYLINANSSNIFDFREAVNAVYGQFNSIKNDKEANFWKYAFGLRAEQVNNNGATLDVKTKFKNNYLKIFPTANVSFYTSQLSYWKLSYGKRINRPSLGNLNPFVDITDALNPHSGNPNLKPEIAHNLELGYNKETEIFSLSSSLFYRYTKNTIRAFFQLQPNGANLNLPINIGNANTSGLETILAINASKKFDCNLSVSLFEQQINGSNVADDAVQDAFGWYGKYINNFIPWQNGKIQIIGNYNSSLVTPQGKRIAQYYADLGFQQKLYKKGNARLGITIVDVFNTLKNGYINNTKEFSSYRYGKVDTRAIMITFGYSFKSAFKEKIMDNKFSKEY